MKAKDFIAACEERLICFEVVLENEQVKEALKEGDDREILRLLDREKAWIFLEDIVDKYTLTEVIEMLASICGEKAIASIWISSDWEKASKQLRKIGVNINFLGL